MPRNRRSARQAGTRFERAIADHFKVHLDDRIDRRVKYGSADRGDLGGIRMSPALGGGRVVAELKNVVHISLGPWYTQADIERGNDSATIAVVISKRFGVGDPGQQWVHMTVDDLIGLLLGARPESDR